MAEDAWAYTPESLRSIKRSLADIAAGRVHELTTEELLRLAKRRRRSPPRAR